MRPFRKGDEKSLAENINNKKIYRNTLNIPYPYTLKDGKKWIDKNLKEARKKKPAMINFAIDIGEKVVGSVGFSKIKNGKAELGYWLAERYWGRRIMTEAVKLATKFGFKKLGFERICATVFSFNKPSQRVLAKTGYKYEETPRKHVRKNNKLIDVLLFVKVK